MPKVLVSPSLTKFVIYGKDIADATKGFYNMKTVDYGLVTTADVTIPNIIKNALHELSLSE